MKILACPDSFKGALDARAAARAIAAGFRRGMPGARVVQRPMADGGEGTLEVIVSALGGSCFAVQARDPLGRPVIARAGLAPGGIGIAEMASASGLPLLRPSEYDPGGAGTEGTGDLIRALLDRGSRRVIVGLGGSATVDGGAGMARALGVRFLDRRGREVTGGGSRLREIVAVDLAGIDRRVARTRFTALCDVSNPLSGEHGAAPVYGPQKGAGPRLARELDEGLANFGRVIERETGRRVSGLRGAGAAGGLGAAMAAFLGARLRPGIEAIIEETGFEEQLSGTDLAVTGEGRVDGQARFGKALAGIARAARRHRVPLVALCGSRGEELTALRRSGITAVFSIVPGPLGLEEAMSGTARLVSDTCAEIARLLRATSSFKP